MNRAFGQSFDDIRILRDSARARGPVQAVTEGRTIHFAPGRYRPGTARGDWLIGHELAHVVQQSGGARATQAFADHSSTTIDRNAALEAEADRAADNAVAGRPAQVVMRVPFGWSQAFAGTDPQQAGAGAAADKSAVSTTAQSTTQTSSGRKEDSESRQPQTADPGTARAVRSLVPADTQSAEADAGAAQTGQSTAAGASATAGQNTADAGTGSGPAIELLMPEPPSTLSEAAHGRLSSIAEQAHAAGQATAALPGGAEITQDARGAVEEPTAEQNAMAEAAAVEQVDERPAPSAAVEEACARIRSLIKAKRPPDEKSLVDTKPAELAEQAGGQVNSDVESRAGAVRGGYKAIEEPADGQPSRTAVTAKLPAAQVATPTINAEAGVPDPLSADDVSLDGDVAQQQQAMTDAGMDSEPAKLVQSGPIAEARQAAQGLGETAQTGPEKALAEQAAAIDKARGDMRALQEAASASLAEARAGAVGGIARMSVDTTASEEQQRAQAGAAMQSIFASAQKRVDELLEPISARAIERWDAGVKQLSQQFEASLADVKRRVEARYRVDTSGNYAERFISGVGATFNRVSDALVGLPDEIVAAYDRAEERFASGCCDLARDISRDVNQIVDTCEQIIAQARQDLDRYVESLPGDLRRWARGQADRVNEQLDSLNSRVTQTRDGLNRDLIDRANKAVQQVRERVHKLREEAKGLVGQIQGAITAFLEDPGRFIINGLLELVGIEPGRFWAMVDKLGQVIDGIAADPMGFANNRMTAVGHGFRQFF
ncbi:MAG: DUF4157 domain-containing protein, partial [Myxococcota bacterium]